MTKEVIYTLLLQGNHYYVGRTNNVNRRFKQHENESGKGSIWTSKYKPIKVYNVEPLIHPYQELTTTLTMMKEHGIERVRGDIFTAEHLSDAQMKQIKMSIASEDGLCYVCMQKGHIAQYCPNRKNSSDVIKGKVTSKKSSKNMLHRVDKSNKTQLKHKTTKKEQSCVIL
jgi:predicted GIY-YIG superfamily endonuclease